MDRLSQVSHRDFDWSLDPKELREIFKQTSFDSIFYKLIAKDVIKTLSPQKIDEPHNLVYDEDLVYEQLILPLEKFVCGLENSASPDDVSQSLAHIQTLNQPSKLCRRILKAGDVTFSCNDCGLDGTCVVCIDCFHKGAHKDHNYRMSNSDGGGCCDCGDTEAWKQNYACTDHMAPDQANMSLSDFEDAELRARQIEKDRQGILEKINRIDKGVASRYFLICQASLHYARTLLTWVDYNALPQHLEIADASLDPELEQLLSKVSSSKNYFTVLFNDEVHTYDYVINTLVKIIKCTKMTASVMASTISREGRSLIVNDNYKYCKQVKDSIANVRDSAQDPLKVEIIHGSILAHQAFALKLIEWVQKMASLSDAFRVLTACTLLGTYDPIPGCEGPSEGTTLLERIMLSNTAYWKIIRVEFNDLFVRAMLTEYSVKEQFARLITRIYPQLMRDFIQDDHDHSVSILTMTTQLYTVPSLICLLIEEENALAIITQTLINTCGAAKRENPTISFENRNTYDMNSLKRGLYIMSDLRHLINIQPSKWTDQLRKNVIESVKIFLNLLSSMQGTDAVRRQLGQHLEYEPDWESGMTLQSRLVIYITRLVSYCSHDEVVLKECLLATQERLLKNGGYKMVSRDLFGHQVSCIQYDVSTSPVSVHLPLTRFAAALIMELMRQRPSDKVPYDESLIILTKPESGSSRQKHSMIDIMEPSLRTEVMIAQFRSGMWRRNGYSLVNQIMYFHGALMRREMFDRDILVLQECAATCEANEYMIHLLNKFQLFTWVSQEITREPLVSPKVVSFYNDEEIMTQTMSLGEEFLQLLLTIISERHRVGIGKIEEEDVMKNEIIQLLCVSPFTRSDLMQKLYVNDNELDCIKAVANLKRSTEASTGKYELKSEYYERFNPFFYHYSRRQQSNALDAQLKRKKNLKETLICCPPPPPVELTSQFINLNQLLQCDITLIVIQKILRRALGHADSTLECPTKAPIRFTASDLQLDQSLHLIGLGLWEQERDPLGFRYLQAAHEKEIFVLLKNCYEEAKRSKDLIFWLMRKTSNLIDKLNSTEFCASLDEQTNVAMKSVEDLFKATLSACDSMKQDSKKLNSELAAQRRERIMAMMRANQDKFLSNPSTKQLVAETERTEAPKVATGNWAEHACSSAGQPTRVKQTTRRLVRPRQICTTKLRPARGPAQTSQQATGEVMIDQPQASENDATDDPEGLVSASSGGADEYESIKMDENEETVESEPEDEFTEGLAEPPETTHLCILCRDEQRVAFDQPTMVLLAYIQRSAVLSKNRSSDRRIPNYSLTPSNQLKHQAHLARTRRTSSSSTSPSAVPNNIPDMYSYTSDNSWSFDATFMPSDLFFGPHISTCGHAMHYGCWQGFFDTITKRETSRSNRNARHVSFELEKLEILCPLCECISNATIPLLPNYTRFARRRKSSNRRSPVSAFGSPEQVINKSAENLSSFLHALRASVDTFRHIRHITEVTFNISPSVSIMPEDKYMRLLQPKPINEALEELHEVDALGLRDFVNSIRNERVSSKLCTTDLLNSISALTERIHLVGLDLDRSIGDVNHARMFMMTTWSISYTIQAYERAARFKGSPLIEDLEASRNLCLSSLLRFACGSMMILQQDVMQSLLVRKLRYLIVSDEHFSSSPSCLDIDAFEIFVSLFILLQKLYSHNEDSARAGSNTEADQLSGSLDSSTMDDSASSWRSYPWMTSAYDHEYFRNLLHLTLILNTLQVIISLHNELTLAGQHTSGTTAAPEEPPADSSKEILVLYSFYKEIILASGHPNHRLPLIDERFVGKLKRRLLPYLRACAVFFFHLSRLSPPDELRNSSAFFEGKEFSAQAQTNEFVDAQQSFEDIIESERVEETDEELAGATSEFAAICRYLDLPEDLGCLYKSQEARHLSRSWLRHSRVLVLIKSALSEPEKATQKASVGERTRTRTRTSSSCSTSIERSRGANQSSSSLALSTSPQASSFRSSSMASVGGPPTTITATELMPVRLVRQPHIVNRLIELPYDYSELVDKVSDFTCPSIKNEDSRTPTMCLICGVMMCSQSYCCQRDLNELASNYQEILQRQQESRAQAQSMANEATNTAYHRQLPMGALHMVPASAASALSLVGLRADALLVSPAAAAAVGSGSGHMSALGGGHPANAMIHQQLVGSCTHHAYECSGGVGVFLRIRNCQILLLSGRSKGCYLPAPYIDDHGETDFGLQRGNPMHLNGRLYERLQHMWLSHAIPEQISRTLEYSSYAASVNWHLH